MKAGTGIKTGGDARLQAAWVLYFNEVAQCLSIREAARRLRVSPSAISRQIKEIEDTVGSKLLERIPNGLRLTLAGESVALHAAQMLQSLERLHESMDELKGLRRGHVRISAIQAASADLVPQIVSRFARYPRISYGVRFVGSNEVVQQVVDGEADIGISFESFSIVNLRHLVSVPLPFGAIVPPDHSLAGRSTVDLQDLIGQPLILPDRSISTRLILDEVIRGSTLGFAPLMTSSSPEFIFSAVASGAGVGFQTPVGIERELREKRLVFLPLMYRRLKPPQLTVSISSRRPLSTLCAMVAEVARSTVSDLLA